MFLLISIPLGILVGWMRGGRLRNLEHLPIRGLPLLIIPCLLEYAGGFLSIAKLLPQWGLVSLILAAYTMLILAIWMNRRIAGLGVLAFGFVMNLLVVTVNGFRMPLSGSAAARAGLEPSTLPGSFKLIGEHTAFPFLADLIPIPAYAFHPPEVMSAGDVLVMVGVFLVIQAGMCASKSNPK